MTETLSGRADRIKAYSIAVEVFGRGASFDPQSDPVVRIEAGRVRRALERYYLTAGSSDPIAITIPKGSYVPVFSRERHCRTRGRFRWNQSLRRLQNPPTERAAADFLAGAIGLCGDHSCHRCVGGISMALSLHARPKWPHPASMPAGRISRNFWSSRLRMRLGLPKAQPSPSG